MALPELFEGIVQGIFYITTPECVGTGFLVRRDGLVITNYHVVEGHIRVSLQPHAGLNVRGEVIMADIEQDLAAIRVIPGAAIQDLPVLPIGVSRDVRVGDEVVAIGHPEQSAAFSLCRGIVSALSHVSGNDFLMQANLSINSGNSGGPLLKASGLVVGMVSSTPNTCDRNRVEGISFAIPADLLSDFVARIPDLSKGLSGFLYCRICGHLGPRSPYCSHCGSPAEVNEGSEWPDSGTAVSPSDQKCAVCDTTNPSGNRYCKACGVRFSPATGQ